jgi:hypothetical protein
MNTNCQGCLYWTGKCKLPKGLDCPEKGGKEMSNIEKIRQKIERLYDGEVPKHDQQCDFGDGYFTGLATILNIIDTLLEEKPSEDLLDAAKDALLLERAWLTLDNFGHEELAGRLRQFAERKGLIWK